MASGAGVNVPITGDATSFLRSTQQAADALGNVGKAGEVSGHQLNTGLAGGMQTAEAEVGQSVEHIGTHIRRGVATSVLNATNSFQSLGQAGISVAAGIATAFPGVGIAVGAVAVIVGEKLVSAFDSAKKKSEEAAKAAKVWSDAVVAGNGAVQASFLKTAVTQDVESGKLQKLIETGAKYGFTSDTITRANYDQGNSLQSVWAGLNANLAAQDALYKSGQISVGQYAERLQAIQAFSDALGTNSGAAATGTEQSQQLAAATAALSGATEDTTKAQADATKAAADAAAGYQSATGTLINYTDAFVASKEAIGAWATTVQGAAGARLSLEQAVITATKALKDNGKTLDENTQKGNDNAVALYAVATAAEAHEVALSKAGFSQERVNSATKTARDEFIALAIHMGDSAKEAKALADNLGLLPNHVKVKVDVEVPLAVQQGITNKINAAIRAARWQPT